MTLNKPSIETDDPEEAIVALYEYLCNLIDKLNYILEILDEEGKL